jgi:photosystem II stability/assembly factor-like uncharacterized protein
MKRKLYIVFIALTALISFGFKGCQGLFCDLTILLNWAKYGRGVTYAVGENKIFTMAWEICDAEVEYVSLSRLEYFQSLSAGLESNTGSNYFCAVGDSGEVVLSPDGGSTWEERGVPGITKNLFGLDFFFLGSNEPGVVVCGEGGIISVSTDLGVSWATTNTITTENLNSIIAVQKTLFIAVGGGGTIIKTYDQGQTWEDHTVGGEKFNRIFDGGKVQAYGYLWVIGDGGRIYATTNYGISWFPQNSGVTENLNDIQFRSQTEGMVVGNNGVVRYTSDGGTTWQEDSYFNGLTDGDIISLATVDFNTGVAVVRNTTREGGSTTSMFIVSTEPLDVDENGKTSPSQYSLEQNYPNPFNPTTKINYSVPQLGLVTIKVYDLLGKEVATLIDEEKNAGNYQIDFNGYGLPSGIYFYKLTAGNFSETKKLVLMK